MTTEMYDLHLSIPNGLIVFFSGVPGVGKTTISYELLKRYNEFRIIQETDLIREILRGYNDYISTTIKDQSTLSVLNTFISIPDHTKIFNYDELIDQCYIMKKSIEMIVARQQRKGISSIINGVHIVPEVLNGISCNGNVIFINLYIDTPEALRLRLLERDHQKYLPFLDVSFATNCSLYNSTSLLSQKYPHNFLNIDVTYLTVDQVLNEVIAFIELNKC